MCSGSAGTQFKLSHLHGDKGGPSPSVGCLLGQQLPDQVAQLVLQPMALLMAEEMTAKLGTAVQIDVVRPMQAYDMGGKARALATMVQALAQAKEAGIEGATLQDALSFIDWQDE